MIAAPSAPPADADLRTRILGGFRGDVASLRPSPRYRAALFAVAIAMVLLPVAYVGLIAAVGWGLWSYGRFAFVSLLPEYHSGYVILLELLPLFVGAVILLCLVKPLFARSERPSPPVKLDPRDEPLLFEFVARLCAALHAPIPREIHVDCAVNASASFRRGWTSLFHHDLVLTLGLPLVEGLPLQQLAGVLAHELGHFSQTAGLRFAQVIRTINFWLTRAVYQRDRFDLSLERSARQLRGAQFRMAVRIALLAVSLIRKILWALMMLGHTLSSYLLRQMEYDADRYEVRLAGFSSFDLCLRELFALNAARAMALDALQEQWKEARLVDNFPRLIIINRRQAARSIAQEIEPRIAREPEGRFDTHPTVRQRVAHALREKGLGVFTCDLPATALFADFEALERRVSLAFYRERVGNLVKPHNLIPIEEIKARQERSETEGAALDRYFHHLSRLKGLPLPSRLPPPPADPRAVAVEIAKARQNRPGRDEDHALALRRYEEAVQARLTALQAQAVLEAGFTLRPGQFNVVDGTLPTAVQDAEEAAQRMSSAGRELAAFEEEEIRPLLFALSRLETREEAERLLACAALLTDRLPSLFRVRETCGALKILGAQIKPGQENPRLGAALRERFGALQEQLKEVHRGLRGQDYPFDHAQKELTLAQFALPSMPVATDFQGLMGAAEQALERLGDIYDRLLGRLVRLAEQVEADLAASRAPAAAPQVERTEAPAVLRAEPIRESKADAVESRERFVLYFRDLPELRPLALQPPAADGRSLAAATARGELAEARHAASQGIAAYSSRARQYQAVERKYFRALRAERLLAAGLTLRPMDFDPLPTTFPAIVEAGDQALAEMSALGPGLQAFEAIQAHRLLAALALLQTEDDAAARIPDADRRRREIPPLLACVQALQGSFPVLRELRKLFTILRGLGERAVAAAKDPHFGACVTEQVAKVQSCLRELQKGLHGEPYPFIDDRGAKDLVQFAVPTFPHPEDVNGNFQAAGYALKELLDLHRRVLGRLAGTADEVERRAGAAGSAA